MAGDRRNTWHPDRSLERGVDSRRGREERRRPTCGDADGQPYESLYSDSVKRHLSRRHLSVLLFLFNFVFNGGCTCEKEIRFR